MKAVDIFLIVVSIAFGASMLYSIQSGLERVAMTSFRIGCASVQAPAEVVEQCKAQAYEKVVK